jgi:hypothetical protein
MRGEIVVRRQHRGEFISVAPAPNKKSNGWKYSVGNQPKNVYEA